MANGNGNGTGPRLTPNGAPVVEASESEKMFLAWIKCGDKTAVAKQFKRSRSTVNRIAAKNGWDKRKGEIETRVDDKVADHIAKTEMSDYDLLHNLRNKIFNKMLSHTYVFNPTIHEAVAVVRLMQEMTGTMPTAGAVNLFQLITDGTIANYSEPELADELIEQSEIITNISGGKDRLGVA